MASRIGRSGMHVILLAGGSGTRFWPLSRADLPKQFLPLTGGRPLLVESWRRALKLAPPARIWVVAPAALAQQVRALLPDLQLDRLVIEPSPRDTAPAVGLACAAVARVDPRAVAAIFPTDHVIQDTSGFIRAVRVAADAAGKDALVCLGIRPDRPATGYGYLQCSGPALPGRACEVAKFVEKPDLARARRFVRSGEYLWNAGMFVWRVDRFLSELERTAPTIRRAVLATVAGRKSAWRRAPRMSVDFAVMEKARGVRVVPLDVGWDDIGSWDAACRLREKEPRGRGRPVILDSAGSVVFGGDRLVALVDVPDVTVVDTPDALLVVAHGSSQRVREVVAELRRRGRKDLL